MAQWSQQMWYNLWLLSGRWRGCCLEVAIRTNFHHKRFMGQTNHIQKGVRKNYVSPLSSLWHLQSIRCSNCLMPRVLSPQAVRPHYSLAGFCLGLGVPPSPIIWPQHPSLEHLRHLQYTLACHPTPIPQSRVLQGLGQWLAWVWGSLKYQI